MVAGRKRAFNEEKALQAAMDVFWQKGYVGASLSELTQRMGINKPSMYSTFGNKESLFIKATNLYIEQKAKPHFLHLYQEGQSLKTRLKNYMLSVVRGQCESDDPKGCYIFLCESEVVSGDVPELPSRLLSEASLQVQQTLTDILLTDAEAIKLGLNTKAACLALCLATTLRGTASMARAGVAFTDLEIVVDHSLVGIGLF